MSPTSVANPLQFGLDTFKDVSLDAIGKVVTQAQVLRHLVDQGIAAEQAGIDSINIGEHHRPDFAVSAPDVVLAAIASRTARISLGTAVTVLSSDDPVRVYERFATLDAVSSGRAEVTLGRGSFTESFPLFGFDLSDYESLLSEKLELFNALRSERAITWAGRTRAPLQGAEVFPRTESGGVRTWIGIGGSPESVIRAAHYGIRSSWQSSVATLRGLRRTATSTTERCERSASRSNRSESTRLVLWPKPTKNPANCSSRT